MINFDFFDNSNNNDQCRCINMGSFVISIAHYMRAYFNDQALNLGDFLLPGDAGYLNGSIFNIDYSNLNCLSAYSVTISNYQTNTCPRCVLLQETESAQQKLYAKIGCMD